jgi:hypothetical protein
MERRSQILVQAFNWLLKHHLLDLIQTHDIVPPVIELGRPGAFMRCHLLCFFEIPAISQVNRDPGRPEGVAANFSLNPGLTSTPANHVKGVFTVERPR